MDPDWPPMPVQADGQIILWDATCTKVQTAVGVQNPDGTVTMTVPNATPGDLYYLSVKYKPDSLKGTDVNAPYPDVTYTFVTDVNGTPVSISSGAGVTLTPK